MNNYEYLRNLANYIYENNYKTKADDNGTFELLEDEEGVISQIDNMICGVISDNQKLMQHQCLDYFDSKALLAELLSRTCETNAPLKTTYGQGMKTFTVAIGNDETATVALHFNAIDILRRYNSCKDTGENLDFYKKFYDDNRVALLQYESLRLNFNKMVTGVLGKGYYNMGMDVYEADRICCEDIAKKAKK